MIHIGIDADLCNWSLYTAEMKLLKTTKKLAIGIIVGKYNKEVIDEMLALSDNFLSFFPDTWINPKLKVNVIESLPIDMWILYNDVDAIYSNGA